jgi:hypothetical protein
MDNQAAAALLIHTSITAQFHPTLPSKDKRLKKDEKIVQDN